MRCAFGIGSLYVVLVGGVLCVGWLQLEIYSVHCHACLHYPQNCIAATTNVSNQPHAKQQR